MLVDYFHLLTYRLFVNQFEYMLNEIRIHTEQFPLCSSLIYYLFVSVSLQNRHIMLFLIAAYLSTDVHAIGKNLYKVIVEGIYLLS